AGYDPGKGFIECPTRGFQKDNLEKIRLISSYCTEAELQKKGGRYQILGDPTEGALITLSRKRMVEERKALKVQRLKILETIPFDSERKLMSVVTDGKERHLLTKGSPDELLTRCTHVLVDGKVKPFSSLQKKKVQHSLESMASDALRLIGFAYRPLKTTENPRAKEGKQKPLQLEKNLIFVGLAGMIDPPREEVPRAVGLTHKAGIRSIIITGDHGLTAKAIALKIGMATDETPVITGSELEKMKDRQLDKVLKTKGPLIFSRVSPEHKRRIVDRLKHLGEVVAVTGDGVNDAPALKRADLGIAMGITGTEVAKETAHMILLDDSYATIVTAVSEGRKIYGNLRKFTWFIFSCNIGELLTVFSAILLQIPVPLTASLILAVNLGTDILPGIALGVDHAEPNVMNKPPRDPKARIMNRSFVTHFVLVGLFVGAVVVGVYLFRLSTLGWAWGEHLDMLDPIHIQASTLAFATLVVIQLFNAFNARSFTYSVFRLRTLKPLWGAVTASVALVLAIIYLPFFQNIFHTTGLSLSEWFMVIGAGLMVLIVEELRKLIFTNHGESR
ncbi:MAG: HAD-IC family P-type ATPase, partial [Candidatus Gracilibacteria bacterium]|nr:HAD-IC family P-type ATPase [Candidatus Gracilibacteria bacterium]